MDTVLTQKLSARRVGRSPLPNLEELGAHFAFRVEQKLRKLFRTSTGAMILTCEVRKLARVLEDIPVPAMLGLVSVEGSEDSALININSDLVFNIVDLRMGGNPAVAPVPTARTFTAIDCALCEAFASGITSCFTSAVEQALLAPVNKRLELDRIEQNITQIRLAPSNADVLSISVNLDIGEAARTGDFELIVPLSVLDVLRAEAASAPREQQSAESHNLWKRHMKLAAAEAEIDMTAIIHSEQMRLTQLQELSVGDLIPISHNAMEQIELRIGPLKDSIVLGTATLGSHDGRKMARLNGNPETAIRAYVGASIQGAETR